jgi:beta-lactam-binding protein with PASTA domain
VGDICNPAAAPVDSMTQEDQVSRSILAAATYPGVTVRCPAGHIVKRTVSLARPLAGRVLQGTQTQVGGQAAAGTRVVVPRLVGFAPQDAQRALALADLRGTVILTARSTGLMRVVAQTIKPGTTVRRGTQVRLQVARG